ncbi:MAG TPA: HTTM domain-containing protein [Polyangiaceae bacterium]|nr:HTTM domain-containing protein [Polyangiaceae bacterium]
MKGFLTEEREAYVLGLLRVAFSLLLLRLTLRMAREAWPGPYFGAVFHMPLLPEGFVLGEQAYAGLLVLQGLGCVLSLVGIFARPALLIAALCGLYGFFCDRLHYHNNRYELLLLTLLVSVTPCDRSFLPFRRARLGPAPRWAARLVGAQLSIVYLASSLGKLFDPDWRSGLVMLHRFSYGKPLAEQYLGSSAAALLSAPWFTHAASLAAIASELFLAVGLWLPRTRALCLWLGFVFHLGIELSARVSLFSYTMLSGYLVFVTPELRERALSWNARRQAGQRLGALCARLDILARFRHEQRDDQTPLLVTRDRDGRLHEGLSAFRELARATPILFPLWLPLLLVTWPKRRGS